MIREVVKEIYQKPREPKSFIDVLSTLGGEMRVAQPEFINPEQGRALAHGTTNQILLSSKTMAKAAINKNNDEYRKGVRTFNYSRDGLLMLLVLWAGNINKENSALVKEIDRPMNECKRHLEEMAGQSARIIDNLSGIKLKRPNYINAMREFEHLKEIASNLKESIDELFNLTKGMKFK